MGSNAMVKNEKHATPTDVLSAISVWPTFSSAFFSPLLCLINEYKWIKNR